MKDLTNELAHAIRLLEQTITKMEAKEEICVSDLEFDIHEMRASLFEATEGKHPFFD